MLVSEKMLHNADPQHRNAFPHRNACLFSHAALSSDIIEIYCVQGALRVRRRRSTGTAVPG